LTGHESDPFRYPKHSDQLIRNFGFCRNFLGGHAIPMDMMQGCSTLSTIVPLEQGIEATQRGGVSVLAEGADLVAAQDVVAEAA
jgi:hypothetical protein